MTPAATRKERSAQMAQTAPGSSSPAFWMTKSEGEMEEEEEEEDGETAIEGPEGRLRRMVGFSAGSSAAGADSAGRPGEKVEPDEEEPTRMVGRAMRMVRGWAAEEAAAGAGAGVAARGILLVSRREVRRL